MYQSYDLHEAPKGEEDTEQHLYGILRFARRGVVVVVMIVVRGDLTFATRLGRLPYPFHGEIRRDWLADSRDLDERYGEMEVEERNKSEKRRSDQELGRW